MVTNLPKPSKQTDKQTKSNRFPNAHLSQSALAMLTLIKQALMLETRYPVFTSRWVTHAKRRPGHGRTRWHPATTTRRTTRCPSTASCNRNRFPGSTVLCFDSFRSVPRRSLSACVCLSLSLPTQRTKSPKQSIHPSIHPTNKAQHPPPKRVHQDDKSWKEETTRSYIYTHNTDRHVCCQRQQRSSTTQTSLFGTIAVHSQFARHDARPCRSSHSHNRTTASRGCSYYYCHGQTC